MLSCQHLSVETKPGGSLILDDCNVQLQESKLTAIVGPSGSGKSTLVHALLGTRPSTGVRLFKNRSFQTPEQLGGKVALAPQFSVVIPLLTVGENLRYALKLAGLSGNACEKKLDQILDWTGLTKLVDQRAKALSGGQTRRLGLALELATEPEWLICDEVTSGLDPKSEKQILAVLRKLQEKAGLTVVCIIHNLERLDSFDEVVVVHHGKIRYQGSPAALLQEIGISQYTQLFEALEQQEELNRDTESKNPTPSNPTLAGASVEKWRTPAPQPLFILRQVLLLLERRLKLLGRDPGTILLLSLMTVGFPVLVVIFAIGGLPQIEGLSLQSQEGMLERLQDSIRFQRETSQTGSLVSGLILFQVILLALMGSNNGSREIAGERNLYEKERLRGLSPFAYGSSKALFVGGIAVVQGAYMCWFVKVLCGFPGDAMMQTVILILVSLSMTWVALAFSALMQSSEKASLLSIYLVGFQLPLSGIVLALPELLVDIIRPFIAAYWGWSGYLVALREPDTFGLYDAVILLQEDAPANFTVAAAMLILQIIAAFALVLVGVQRKISHS